jgi:sugar phosphate isomerase/epimerase
MRLFFAAILAGVLLDGFAVWAGGPTPQDRKTQKDYQLFAQTNLVAWCIVPFDSKKRNSEERAEMLNRLGISKLAYDYRAEHIPSFDQEVEAMQKHGIEIVAWWFPTELNAEAKLILDVLKRHHIKPQLWVMGGGGPANSAEEQKARVKAEAARLRPIAEAAAKLGCKVGLYNHGGWFGEPENQLEIIKELGMPNVGIVYNQHHGHDHLARFPSLLQQIKPHLLALNLNGMTRDGEKNGHQILPIGKGELDAPLLKVINDSGWRGPIGILNHTDEDAETRLRENLEGLKRLAANLQKIGKAPGSKQ